jgi:hypothetical protein
MKTFLVWLALVGGCYECEGDAYDCTSDTCRGLDAHDCLTVGKCHLADYRSEGVSVRTQCGDAVPAATIGGPACDTVETERCFLRTDCTTVLEYCNPPTVVCPADSWMLTACE